MHTKVCHTDGCYQNGPDRQVFSASSIPIFFSFVSSPYGKADHGGLIRQSAANRVGSADLEQEGGDHLSPLERLFASITG